MMDGNTMGTAVANAIKAHFSGMSTNDINNMDPEEIWQVICTEIVSHIQANAVATGTDAPTGDTHALTIT